MSLAFAAAMPHPQAMPDIRFIAHGSPDYQASVVLRRAILRTPLGLDFTAGQLAAEQNDLHIGAYEGDRLTGVCILTPYEAAGFKLRQMAVSETARGSGTGAALLKAAESTAREKGGVRIVLEARQTARGFYERFGYKAYGGEFIQVTIPHIMMDKTL